MNQRLCFGWDALGSLSRVLVDGGYRRPFIVTGSQSYAHSGAAIHVEPVLQSLNGLRFECTGRICDVGLVRQAYDASKGQAFDCIIAIGGGMVLDVAKVVGIMMSDNIGDPSLLVKTLQPRSCLPIIAIPTTAGSGSEATHFAVMYDGVEKYSVAHASLLPVVAIVDPALTMGLPSNVTASSGMDAIAQAIESFWAVGATAESRAFARESLTFSVPSYLRAVLEPAQENRTAMSQAAHLAGKAINISKTTAPHALSYVLTSQYGVPHGEAVSIMLPHLMEFNSKVQEVDCVSPQGAAHVRGLFQELYGLLHVTSAEGASSFLTGLAQAAGLRSRLKDISPDTTAIVKKLEAGVNVERLSNNPRRLTQESLAALVSRA